MNKHPLLSLDVCLNELLKERLFTQNIMAKKGTTNVLDSAYVAQAKPRNRDLS